MASLRSQLPVLLTASDDLGNQTLVDAGLVTVSRWVFAFDGGTAVNSFGVSPAGQVVVPNTPARQLTVLGVNGSVAWSHALTSAPVRNVAIGQGSTPLVFVVTHDSSSLTSAGESFELSTGIPIGIWASEVVRVGLLLEGPLVASRSGVDSVAALSLGQVREAEGVWARFAGLSVAAGGTTTMGPVLDAGILTAAAYGGEVVASDGFTIAAFASGTGIFNQLSPQSRSQSLPAPFTAIDQLIGRDGGYAGIGVGGGGWRTFTGRPPATFAQWGGGSLEPLANLLLGVDGLYYSRRSQPPFVCKTEQAPASTVCVQQAAGEQVSALALGASKSLYVSIVRGGTSHLQVRDAQTLALRDEVPLPGTTGACTSLTPTCIAGQPVLGCVDSTGTIVFVSTDARGIDTTADWPMEGHDPGKTFNASTPLAPYACP